MWVWLDRVTPLLLDASLAAAVLTSMFLALLLVCLQPARRIALARTAILGVLAIAPLTSFAPWPRFQIAHTFKRSILAPRQIFVRRASSRFSVEEALKSDREAIAMIPVGDESPLSTTVIRMGEFARRPFRLIVLGYLVIVFFGLASSGLGYLGIWWLIRGSSPPSTQTMNVFRSLLAEFSSESLRRHPPHLRISNRVSSPVVVSLLHPTILLPPHFDSEANAGEGGMFPASEGLVRLSLLHELAHAGRHDASFRLIGSLAQAIWFFLPQLWWIRAQLRLDQEFLADHVACRAYGTSSQYAASLLDLASGRPSLVEPAAPTTAKSSTPCPAGHEEVASSLGQRLLMLLHCPYRLEPLAPRGWLWGLRIAGIAATVALANVSIRLPGVAYGSSPSQSVAMEQEYSAEETTPFQVPELIIAPSRSVESGRSQSYILPYHLPAHFSMTVDVLATPTRLAHIRLMNLPLGEDEQWSVASNSHRPDQLVSHLGKINESDSEHWHRVRIERDDHGISLSVDQHALPCPADPNSSWISVEPAIGKPVELRNLVVKPTS